MVRPTDKETVAIEKLVPLSTLAKGRKCVMQDHGGKHQSQSGSRESKGEKWSRTFIVISIVKERKCSVNGLRICYFE